MAQVLPGFKTLLVGESGNGKTHSIRTLLNSGIQPLVLATEPGMRALSTCENPGCRICRTPQGKIIELPPIPWAYVGPESGGLTNLIQVAGYINTKDQSALASIKDMQRQGYNQFIQVLKLIEKFTDNTGKDWGNVLSWNTDRALVIDGLSSLNTMAMDMFVGRRPLYDKSDYGIAQKPLLAFITLLTAQAKCHFILMAHPERGADEIGLSKITVNAIGKALGPELPRLFDDMPWADRNGDKFTWNTAAIGRVSKGRNLPIKADLEPSFMQIVESWKRAGGVIEPTLETPPAVPK